MPAYVVAQAEITDWDQYKKYIEAATDVIAQFDGRFISRGGEIATLEGPEQIRRMVLIEFPSMDHAKGWYNSPDYQAARKLRENAANLSIIAITGC